MVSIGSDALRTLEKECLDNMTPELCISELQECEETIRSYWTNWRYGECYYGLNISLSHITYDLTSSVTRGQSICSNYTWSLIERVAHLAKDR